MRNDNAPRFESEPYEKSIKRNANTNTLIAALRTRDEDKQVGAVFEICSFDASTLFSVPNCVKIFGSFTVIVGCIYKWSTYIFVLNKMVHGNM